jgi:FkbH-like protein
VFGMDIVNILKMDSDPLQLGLNLALASTQPDERVQLLTDVLSQYGHRFNLNSARYLTRIADELHSFDSTRAGELIKILEFNNAGAIWLRAALLKKKGFYSDAAALLDTLPDTSGGEERAVRLLARVENLIKAGHLSEAWMSLRDAAKAATSFRTLSLADRLLKKLSKSGDVPCKRRCKIAILGNTTLDLLVPALRVTCFAAGIDAQFYQGAFDQYQQEILDPQSSLGEFAPDVVIIATDYQALKLPDETDDPQGLAASKVSMLANLWRQCHERFNAFVIQYNFEIPSVDPYGRLSAALKGGRGRLLRQINLDLWDAEQESTGLSIIDIEQIAGVYGKSSWNDPTLWYVAKQYPATDAIPMLARRQAALIRGIFGLTSKCLALDLDGTLWGGIIGEDGLPGIKLGGSAEGEAFVAFQRYLKSLQGRGVILAVCSKNNEDDAKLPFQSHPEMVLSLDDIAVFTANWQSKSENLQLIAETINIGLDSIVFLDDNPIERAWMRQELPEVEVPELPQDPALYVQALDEHMYFESGSLTVEDRTRVRSYQDNAKRRTLEASSTSLEEFLIGLKMQVELKAFDESNLPRIVQLINKTNQFNLTTPRLSESQVRSLMFRTDCYTQSMRLRDRFGDSGLTGVLIAFEVEDSLRIDSWLMSCRVLGRRVEEAMFAAVAAYAKDRGLKKIIGKYVPTSKNMQVKDLFDRIGFDRVSEEIGGEITYRWDLATSSFERPGCFNVKDETQSYEWTISPGMV